MMNPIPLEVSELPGKRLAVISDAHCGAACGLTPPDWWGTDKLGKVRRDLWRIYEKEIVNKLRPVDALVCNGDMLDGPTKNLMEHRVTVNRIQQTDMAAEAIKLWHAPRIFVVEGTPFHTGERESWEYILARDVDAEEFGAKLFLEINGVTFDFRHFIGGSSIPGKIPPGLSREAAWNKLKAEIGDEPRADIFVRSHLHTCLGGSRFFGAGKEVRFLVTPGLQGYSNYGRLKVSRVIDFGAVVFEVSDSGEVKIERKIIKIRSQKQEAISI